MLYTGKNAVARAVLVGETVTGEGGPVAVEVTFPGEVQMLWSVISAFRLA